MKKVQVMAVLGALMGLTGCKEEQHQAPLILDTHNVKTVEPRNFRMIPQGKARQDISTVGIRQVHASGSGQFNAVGLQWIQQQLSAIGVQPRHVVMVDLREEPHGFAAGQAISWYAPNNHYNLGISWQEARAQEETLLQQLAQQPRIEVIQLRKFNEDHLRQGQKISLSSQNLATEARLIADQKDMRYERAPISDHNAPEPRDVDQLVALFVTATPQTWFHFHCRAGHGRTTTALILYDIWLNAGQNNITLEEINDRHRRLGGADILGRGERPLASENEKARAHMVRAFWDYVLARRLGETLRFSDWLNSDQKELRQLYLEGRYLQSHPKTPVDRIAALEKIKKAADGGYVPAKLLYALSLHSGGVLPADPEAALPLINDLLPMLKDSAERGNLDAMVGYAKLLQQGLGVAQDRAHARILLQKAAAAEYGEAMYEYAEMLRNGLGGPQDMQAAQDNFKRASDMGFKDATVEYAHFLNAGEVGVSDSQKAGDLLNDLVETGHLGGMIWYMHWLSANAKTAADHAKVKELNAKIVAALGHPL
ncbi:MAG: hypothetical protein ACK5O7_05140 [Holosporales bacterium]